MRSKANKNCSYSFKSIGTCTYVNSHFSKYFFLAPLLHINIVSYKNKHTEMKLRMKKSANKLSVRQRDE